MGITRTNFTDDDGSGTTGTVINNAVKQELYDQIDALAATLGTVPTGGTGVATMTAHGVVLGEGTAAVHVSAAGTAGQPFLSGGASADGAYGTLGVPGGGTGVGTLTGLVVGNGTSAMTAVTAPSGAVVGTSDTQTLTNKRVTPRPTVITSSATPTINTDNCDFVSITALAAAITSMTTNLSGTPSNGDRLLLRIKDDGSPHAITWGASFESVTGVLPTTTVAGKRMYVGLVYDTVATKWGCVVAVTEP